MRSIKVDKVIAEEEERRKQEPPTPKINRRVGKMVSRQTHNLEAVGSSPTPATIDSKPAPLATSVNPQLSELWERMKGMKIDRAKVSNFARDRWKAGAGQSEMKDLYERINNMTDGAGEIYELIRNIEQPQSAPEPKRISESQSIDILKMKERKRVLINNRDKMRRKLKENGKVDQNDQRRIHWQEQLAVMDAEYEDLQRRMKQLGV